MEKWDHATTIRISSERYERLRRQAFERRVHINDIINEALDKYEEAANADVHASVPEV